VKKLALVAALLFPGIVCAQGQANCAGCHGANGEGVPQLGPAIAGQPEPYLLRQLEAYADGRRRHEVMTPIAKGLSRQQRASFAALYSRLAPTPQKTSAAHAQSTLGRTLATKGDESRHVQACENCHGPGGTGQHGLNPHLASLSAAYLENALREFRTGTRVTDPSFQMMQIAGYLSEADIKAVAAHYSGQPLPQVDVARTSPTTGEKDQPTQAGAGRTPAQGVGASGGEATTGGSQGPGGGGGASGSGASGSRSGGTP
jgi:cytochrome c553